MALSGMSDGRRGLGRLDGHGALDYNGSRRDDHATTARPRFAAMTLSIVSGACGGCASGGLR